MTNKTGEKEKIIGVCLPSWDSNEPRFVVKESNDGIAEDRGFKNGTCVFNQRLGFAYSVDEIVEVLNALSDVEDENDELKKEDKRLNNIIIELHDDIRKYNTKVKKQQMLINIQWDIIASLMELKGVMEDDL